MNYGILEPAPETYFLSIHASVAERSIATDCKSVVLWATLVQIQPDAQKRFKNLPCGRFLAFVNRSDVLVIPNTKTTRSGRRFLVNAMNLET